jgi:flagellar biosynthesis protein FlhF
VALVSTDNFRIGAHEQLHTYGRILGVPVQVAGDRDELVTILKGHYDKKLVLIDTAGMSQRDLRLAEQLATLSGSSPVIRTYLVLSATNPHPNLNEVVQSFRRTDLAGCILTKVDEAVSLGGALAATIQHQLPVAYVSDGQRVPEDMHPARAHALVSRAAAMLEQVRLEPGQDQLAQAFGGKVAHAHV